MVDRHCVCKRNGEIVDHLSLHCDVARDMGFDSTFLGYAPMGGGVVGLLEMLGYKPLRYRSAEVDSSALVVARYVFRGG